jgi:AcrR family transcriptional regulator
MDHVPAQSPEVRPPRQRRSRESFERVLDAAARLLEENGFEGFTVQEVASRSGVSVGAIYERFGSKESLLRVVHARTMEALEAAVAVIETQDAPAEPAAAIADAVARYARVVGDHRRILRAFMHLGAVDDLIAARGSQASTDGGRLFTQRVLAHRAAIAHPDPQLAADIAFRMVYCTLARQIMYGPTFESARRVSWERLVAELGTACAAYLLSPPELAPPSRRRARAAAARG